MSEIRRMTSPLIPSDFDVNALDVVSGFFALRSSCSPALLLASSILPTSSLLLLLLSPPLSSPQQQQQQRRRQEDTQARDQA